MGATTADTGTCFYCLHSGNDDFQLFVRKLPHLDRLVVSSRDCYEDWVRPSRGHGGLCVLAAHGKGAEVEGVDGKRVQQPWQGLVLLVLLVLLRRVCGQSDLVWGRAVWPQLPYSEGVVSAVAARQTSMLAGQG